MRMGKRHTLLVVDDEADVVRSVHDLLRLDYRVLGATSAHEGLQLVRDLEVHIVMTDQRMPGMNGVELLRLIRQEQPDAIRLLFTGYADIKDGRYDTSSSGGRGCVGGPMIIAIEGTDPNAAPDKPKKGEESEETTVKLLFPRYEIAEDLPKSDTTKDITVPAEASKGPIEPKKKPGEISP